MGSGQSQSIRATHFSRPKPAPTYTRDASEEHHISISNKMVERLVEDAAIAGGAAAAATITPKARGDYKDMIYFERMKCLDDSHSERNKLTMEDLDALVNRIELRTANMIAVEPVCAEQKRRVLECYDQHRSAEETVQCWNTVGLFSACVQEAAARQLRLRTERDAADCARRELRVRRARRHALSRLAPPPTD